MNSSVTATGMQVKAKASGGIVISVYDPTIEAGNTDPNGWAEFGTSATAFRNGTNVELIPTSTINCTNWFTATAAAVNAKAKTESNYDVVSISDYNNNDYVLYNKFEIQTSGKTPISANDLKITDITVTPATNNSGDLNKSLRIALKVTEKDATGTTIGTPTVYFFAPSYDHNAYPNGGVKANTDTTLTNLTNAYGKVKLAAEQITINTQTGTDSKLYVAPTTDVEVYIYYDGEDANCYTNNTLLGVDGLDVSISFGTAAN